MRKATCLLVLFFLYSACQNSVAPELSQTSGLPDGELEAQVQGYITRSIQGEAVFETLHGLGNEPYFWLRLRDLTDIEGKRQYRLIDFVAEQEEPLEQGMYDLPIVEQGQEIESGDLSVTYQDSEVDGVFKSTGGTLEIHASDEAHVEGTFSFTAYDDVATGPGVFERVEIVVSGKFHAVKGEVGIILN